LYYQSSIISDQQSKKTTEVHLNLVSDDTVVLHKMKCPKSDRALSNTQKSQVIHDIGDIHEFYQNRVVTDYKRDITQLKEVGPSR